MRAINMTTTPEAIDADFCGCVECEATAGWPNRDGQTEYDGPVEPGGYYGTRDWHPHGRGPAYLGAELELSHANRDAWEVAVSHLGDVVAEAKPDCSLLEITSHPMTLPSFMRLYPWDMLGELRHAGADANPNIGGLHIHIAKAAFDSADHLFNWWRLHYANPHQINALGGRHHVHTSPSLGNMRVLAELEAGRAAFHRVVHAAAKQSIIKRGQRYLRPEDHTAVSDARRKISSTRSMSYTGPGEVYDVIATQRHTDTFECRFPGATLDPATMKSRLQLVHAGMEYARQLPSTDAAGHAFTQFADWVRRQGRYPELRQAIQAL